MKSPQIKWISQNDPPESFPDPATAFDVPDGLLAAGGDLAMDRLLYAYRHGIFPWFDDGQPILWWSPDPRCVLRPEEFHLSRRLTRYLRRSSWTVSFNEDFCRVIDSCAEDRPMQHGTWITSEMAGAYKELHKSGWAHSVEVRNQGELVGGLYGLAIGRAFFGESMFSVQPNASKAALFYLCRTLCDHQFGLLDCQVESPHLGSLGATTIPRAQFIEMLKELCTPANPHGEFPSKRLPIAGLMP